MELFKLFGTIAVQNAEANRGIDETTDKAEDASGKIKDLGDEGEKSESKLGKAFSKMGSVAAKVGKTIAVGLAAAGTAVVAVGKSAVSAYGDYEQLVGGVETLFKDSSSTVIVNAQNAYKTAGMSANEYMETVTSFSASLLQSLGGDTVAAANKADVAITDMSDNANKMGTSMEAIQNAYQGFAKQNYTMLDNLKLGYGGTKEEMQRLLNDASKISGIKYDVSSYSDIVDAIHVVQNEMGITGTTAEEASTTIQGSLSSMKGAWKNLLTGLTDENQNIDSLITNLFDNIMTVGDNLTPRISKVLDGIADTMSNLAPKLLSKVPEIMNRLLPSVINGATSLINSIVGILPGLTDTLIDILPSLIDGFGKIIDGLIAAAPAILTSLVEGLVMLLVDGLPMLIDGLINLIVTLATNFGQIIQPLIDKLPEIIINVVNALMNNLPALIEGCVQLVVGIVQAIPQIILALIDALPTVISSLVTGLWNALPVLLNGIVEMVSSIGSSISTYFSGLWKRIKNIFAPVINFFKNTFSGAWEGVKKIWNVVSGWFSNLWGKIKKPFLSAGSWFKNIFKGASDGIKNVFGGIADWFKKIFDKVATVVKAPLNLVIKGLNTLIRGANKISFDVPDWVPGFGGKKFGFNLKEIPRLAKGAVVDKPTPAVFGEDGAEAVIPLEKNTGWIRNIARQIHEFTLVNDSSIAEKLSSYNVHTESTISARIDNVEEAIEKIIDMLKTFFPKMLDEFNMSIVLDDGTLVGILSPKINKELGRVYQIRKRYER